MARVAIVSYDVQTIRGKAFGVAAFTTRWARLLREAGEDVTIVMTRCDWEPMSVDPPWRERYRQWGIRLIELQSPPPLPTRWPEVPTVRIAEIAAPVLRNFDIVYLQDWGNPGFHLLRERRYSLDPGPVCVTQIFGPSEWELSSNQKYPDLPADLHLNYQERYAAKHSDFVVSSSAYMVNHLSSLGWEFPGEVPLLGLPMPEPPPPPPDLPAPRIRSIVYFARIEERKGIRLFVQALQHLAKHSSTQIPDILLFGSVNDPDLLDDALRSLKSAGLSATHRTSVDSETSMQYLREHATEILCVVPSPSDNYPYTIVEASLIPGLNLIASNGGGVPDMLDHAEGQLFDPFPRDLAAKIAERLQSPLTAAQLARYDCRAANDRWLAFHRTALATPRPHRTLPSVLPTVDVCTTYFQKAPHLPQLIDALESQTTSDFHVIAIDDGSPDPESRRVFDEQAARVAPRGWDFVRQPNAFVDAARNAAAARGSADLILFVDADDVPSHNAVARLREAITLSGDDALIPSSYLFASDKPPFDPATGHITAPAYATCIPLGMDLVGGLLDPSSFGGSMFLVRRSAFEAIGGFRELRGAGHEDWETYVRLALAGFKVDVLPEFHQFYRQVEGSLARTLPSNASRRRLLAPYEDRLSAAGLQGGALALAGLYEGRKQLETQIKLLTAKVNAPKSGYDFFTAAGKRFEAETTGPSISRLQSWYRATFSLETRLKIHRVLLAPFLGPYEPPSA
jgi:GT2 family glycosyltransferase/glycosyltransferase involved in cell wall biosynthesis